MGKHQGARETSTSRAGSHRPSASPIRGVGLPQKQNGEAGLGVSGAPVAPPMSIGPIEIGNRHSQHTSVIGLTKRPVQDCAQAAPIGRAAESSNASSVILMTVSLPGLRFCVGRIVERDLGDPQLRAGAHDQRGRGAQTEAGRDPPALVEEEGAAMGAGEIERAAAGEDDFRGPRMGQRPSHLDRPRAVDEQQIAAERQALKRIDPRAGGGDDRAVRRQDVALDRDRRIEQPRAPLPRRPQSPRRARGALMRPCARACASDSRRASSPEDSSAVEPSADLRQQVRLGDHPHRAAHAQILGPIRISAAVRQRTPVRDTPSR